MDLNVLIALGATAVGTVGWGMFRSVHARAEANEKDLAAFKLHCAQTFVTSSALEKAIDRFSASIDAVFKKLERIEERLDMKADKT